FVSGAMAKAGKGLLEGTLQAGTSAVSDKLLDLVGLGGKSAADKGKDTRDYLAAAFPELNAWERAGADARSEERFSRNAETDIVCRLLLEKETEPTERQGPGPSLALGIAVLAVLKTGGASVALDPTRQAGRRCERVGDSAVGWVWAQARMG